jgi:hypothetical protein
MIYEINFKNISNNEVFVKEVEVKSHKKPLPRGNFSGCIV